MTPVPSVHIALAKAGHMALPNLKNMGSAILLCAWKERRTGTFVNSPSAGSQGSAFSTSLDNSTVAFLSDCASLLF